MSLVLPGRAPARTRNPDISLEWFGIPDSLAVAEAYFAQLPEDNSPAVGMNIEEILKAISEAIWKLDQSAARVAAAFPPATWDRLRQLKRRLDPANRLRFNANIPPADG